LDNTLGLGDISEIGNILETYFISLRNQSVVNGTTEKKWQTCLAFVKDISIRIHSLPARDRRLDDIDSIAHRLDTLYGQLRIQKSRKPDTLRSLPLAVLEELYTLLAPDSTNHPVIRMDVRWRIFISFICLLRLGLRRGELLILHVDAVKSAFDKSLGKTRYWIDINETDEDAQIDKRSNKPAIKNTSSIRQVPVSEDTSILIQTYIENFRGKPQHPYLLSTQSNTPLSHESLTSDFRKVTNRLSKEALKTLKDRTGKDSVTPHDLRHTCAVVRLNQLLNQGDSMEVALQKMRVFFGWARNSDMPQKYARAVFEDRISGMWSDILDDRVEILRSIPKGH
jgi:integrase